MVYIPIPFIFSACFKFGVTETNAEVNILDFFEKHVIPDLNAPVSGAIHPILKVDAIKYLYTFRGQFTKDQLLGALPLLARHLESTNYAVYTYAAICIERILFMRVSGATGPMMYVTQRLLSQQSVKYEGNVNVV